MVGTLFIYVVFTLIIVFVVVKINEEKKQKWIAATIVIVISILIPTWDIPIGRINYHNLCKNEAGQFIYKQVELGEEYYLKEGERDLRYTHDNHPYAFAKGGELNLERVKQDYVINRNYYRDYSKWGHIRKRVTTITSLLKGEIFGQAVSFHYGSGWVLKKIFNVGSGRISCPSDAFAIESRPYSIHSNLPDKTFIKSSNKGDIR